MTGEVSFVWEGSPRTAILDGWGYWRCGDSPALTRLLNRLYPVAGRPGRPEDVAQAQLAGVSRWLGGTARVVPPVRRIPSRGPSPRYPTYLRVYEPPAA